MSSQRTLLETMGSGVATTASAAHSPMTTAADSINTMSSRAPNVLPFRPMASRSAVRLAVAVVPWTEDTFIFRGIDDSPVS